MDEEDELDLQLVLGEVLTRRGQGVEERGQAEGKKRSAERSKVSLPLLAPV